MRRRGFLRCGLGVAAAASLLGAVREKRFAGAEEVLASAVREGRVNAAALHVRHRGTVFARSFGAARSPDAVFLLASISKPMSVAALMTLYDRGEFHLDDRALKFIPRFRGDGRDKVTVRHLLTHVSGLPDQLPENDDLRRRHAPLSEFINRAIRTPLLFEPSTQYSYSSMGILLAAEMAQRISGEGFLPFIDRAVFQPLEMTNSALGLGRFRLEDTMECQLENANPESGGGDPAATNWDWNSPYWRSLGSPWGGVHGSAADAAKFLAEFLYADGKLLKPETARLSLRNHNPAGLTPRGLGFGIGAASGSEGCSEQTFGHTGATGTLAWADPATDTICVVLTTLPARAANPHPRKLAADRVAGEVA